MSEMKSMVEFYTTKRIYMGSLMNQSDVESAMHNFYYLSIYLDDAVRDMKCLLDFSFFQKELYGNNDKTNKVHYCHHHLVSLFSNITFVKKYIELLNKSSFSKGIVNTKFDDLPRHKIHHFEEDCNTFRANGHIIHGLNVIFDEDDFHLRTVKDINRLLDLVDYKYYYLIITKKAGLVEKRVVDVKELEYSLINTKEVVDKVKVFINHCWTNWH